MYQLGQRRQPCSRPPPFHPYWQREGLPLPLCGEAHGFGELHGPPLEPLQRAEKEDPEQRDVT